MFLLLLMGLGATAQVRIGGNGAPNAAAVLDLNAADTNTGTKGLALPRVSLTNSTTALTGTPTLDGMLVYNTNTATTNGLGGAGIYYWVTNKWVKMLNSDFQEGDGIIGNEVTDATPGMGLVRSGSGTASAPWTLGLVLGNAGYQLTSTGASWALTVRDSLIYFGHACSNCTTSVPLSAIVYDTLTAYPPGCSSGNRMWVNQSWRAYWTWLSIENNIIAWQRTATGGSWLTSFFVCFPTTARRDAGFY